MGTSDAKTSFNSIKCFFEFLPNTLTFTIIDLIFGTNINASLPIAFNFPYLLPTIFVSINPSNNPNG